MQNGVSMQSFAEDPNAIAALDTYTNFVLSPQGVWGTDMENSIQAFAHEKVAMIFAPTWEVEVIKHINPDVSIGVSSVPQIKGGKNKNVANYWVEGVSRASSHQKEAWEFLSYLMEKENMEKMYKLQIDSGRLFGNAYSRMDMATLLNQHEFLGPIIRDGQNLDSFPLISSTYDNGLNDKLINYTKDGVNKVLQGSSSGEALQTMQSGFTQIYTDFSIKP